MDLQTNATQDGARGAGASAAADRVAAPALVEFASATLREALQPRLGGRGARDEALRAAIRRMCDEAHARHLRVEDLLVALKEAWRALPLATRARRGRTDGALDAAVTHCIQEFYSRDRD